MSDEKLTTKEIRFMKAILYQKRDNRWVQENFGMGSAYALAKRGYVTNPLGESGDTSTNLWTLTEQGLTALIKAAHLTIGAMPIKQQENLT